MVVWAALGAALGALSGTVLPLILAIGYAFAYGMAETMRFPVRTLTLTRQLPSTWIRHRPAAVQAVVWGLTLGPGLFTHNYYAGMWLVPMMVALSSDPRQGALVGALVGLTHGLARAFGILRLMPKLEEWERPVPIVLARMRWRTVDGIALMLTAGMLATRVG
jgi:hypothetical protein